MSTMPIQDLELRAYEQRQHLHDRAAELKHKVEEKRYDLSIENQARVHFRNVAVSACALALLSGYVITGLFTRS
jgi:hypothetical protein